MPAAAPTTTANAALNNCSSLLGQLHTPLRRSRLPLFNLLQAGGHLGRRAPAVLQWRGTGSGRVGEGDRGQRRFRALDAGGLECNLLQAFRHQVRLGLQLCQAPGALRAHRQRWLITFT